ncbi:hypothetical protein BH11MYX1_BH11MYX1_42570 [soil metagenome]
MPILIEPFDPAAAKKTVVTILVTGTLSFSKHALDEMAKDNMVEVDAKNALRGGACQLVEFVTSSWRYRFETARYAVVVAFRAEDHAIVVTAWKFKR